jgi:hypothetical protein
MTHNASRPDRAAATRHGGFNSPWLIAFALSFAVALAIISPFLWKGNASGHDLAFHAASWMDAAAQWTEGIFLPRWTEGANYGFGEPRFIFYPPMSWALGAALSFVVPWIYLPAVFIVLTQTLAGLSAFQLGGRLFPQRGALFCSVCYAANPYALLIIYMRSDFAEQLALAFFPLLLLAAMQVADLLPLANRNAGRAVTFLAVVFAAVWLTNAPAGVIASYSVTLFFLWTAVVKKSWRCFAYGAAGMALGFALCGFYLIPAAYEQSWVNISQALSSGLQPSENFLYTIVADAEHNTFNRIASSTAVLSSVLAALFAAVAYFYRDKEAFAVPRAKTLWTALAVLTGASVLLMLRVSNPLWILLPKLRFVQFPWRWMSVPALAFAVFAGAALSRRIAQWYWAAGMIAILAVVLVGSATYMVRHTWWDAEDIPTLREAIDTDQGFEGTDEYDPVGDDHSNLPQKSPRVQLLPNSEKSGRVPDAKFHVERWTASVKEMRINSRLPLRVALRLLKYPAWQAEVNDAAVVTEQGEGVSQVIVALPAGQSHVVVRFTRTADRTIGGVLSAAGFLVSLLMLLQSRRD